MHRFFIPPDCLDDGGVRFPPETSRQIQRVLRLRPGQTVAVLCPEKKPGVEFHIKLKEGVGEDLWGEIQAVKVLNSEPRIHLTLYLALCQREKFEWMLQKCTEAGVSSFVPVITSRTLVQDTHWAGKKTERWRKILMEASEQSGRASIPTLYPVLNLEAALAQAIKSHDLALAAWEAENNMDVHQLGRQVRSARRDPARVAILIGPEGGFSEQEVKMAVRKGAVPFTLGPRVLRMETAALAAAVLVLYEFEPVQ